jgi:uncharacterized protein
MHAAAGDSPDAVRTALAAGAPVDALSAGGETALFVAAGSGAAGAARALVDAGANPDLAVTTARAPSWTPLFAAVAAGRTAVVRVLLEAPAPNGLAFRLETRDAHGRTPLHYAALYGQTEVIRVLVEAGARLDAHDEDGYAPRDFARILGRGGDSRLLSGPGPEKAP